MTRRSWDDYFMAIAKAVSTRGTCDRARVGCVLTSGTFIVATGYNGSIPGEPHCDDVGHDMKDGHCVRTLHAEENAVVQLAKHGNSPWSPSQLSAYCTHQPCWPCFRRLASIGVKRICYEKAYGHEERSRAAAIRLGIHVMQHLDFGDLGL